MSELVLLQPEGQTWWRGGQVPTRTVEYGAQRFQQIHISRLLQGVGKQYKHYKMLGRSKDFLAEFSGSVGIPTNVLVEEIMDGPNELRGTWVHERIALHAAAWALVPLEVWLYGKLVAMFKGQEMTEAPSQPNAVAMLRTMADALEDHGQQLDFLKAEVQEVKYEISKSPLEKACEKYNCKLPWDWTIASKHNLPAKPGAYAMIDPATQDILYIGETKNLRNRLWVNRGKHEGLCYLWSRYYLYETRFILSFENEQTRKWQETEFTAAAKPRWQTDIKQEDKLSQKKHRTAAPPLSNNQHTMYDAA